MNEKKLRVVQWATGNIGTKSLRAVIEHPRLELDQRGAVLGAGEALRVGEHGSRRRHFAGQDLPGGGAGALRAGGVSATALIILRC